MTNNSNPLGNPTIHIGETTSTVPPRPAPDEDRVSLPLEGEQAMRALLQVKPGDEAATK